MPVTPFSSRAKVMLRKYQGLIHNEYRFFGQVDEDLFDPRCPSGRAKNPCEAPAGLRDAAAPPRLASPIKPVQKNDACVGWNAAIVISLGARADLLAARSSSISPIRETHCSMINIHAKSKKKFLISMLANRHAPWIYLRYLLGA